MEKNPPLHTLTTASGVSFAVALFFSQHRSCSPPLPLPSTQVKILDAQLSGSCNAAPNIQITATIPPNAAATVRVPFPAGTDLSRVNITEGGLPVWHGGAFVPGVPGVTGAAAVTSGDLPVGQVTVDITVGAGSYVLTA